MPYVKQETRQYLDDLIHLGDFVRAHDALTDGDMNYIITRLLQAKYLDGRYADFNRAIGVLECAKLEFYRRAVAPYEDSKIAENGDVY